MLFFCEFFLFFSLSFFCVFFFNGLFFSSEGFFSFTGSFFLQMDFHMGFFFKYSSKVFFLTSGFVCFCSFLQKALFFCMWF